jgi:hypothetical protein
MPISGPYRIPQRSKDYEQFTKTIS